MTLIRAMISSILAVTFLCATGPGKSVAQNQKMPTKTPASSAVKAKDKEAEEPKDNKVISLTALEFDEFCKKDPKAAGERYTGKTIELSGVISQFGRTASKTTSEIILEGADKSTLGPMCNTVDKEPWKKYGPGQTVKIRGKCSSYFTPPTLNDCTVTQAGESKAPTLSTEQLSKEYTADPKATRTKYYKKYLILTGEIVAKRGFAVEFQSDGKKKVLAQFDRDLAAPLKVGDKVRFSGEFRSDTKDEIWIAESYPMNPE